MCVRLQRFVCGGGSPQPTPFDVTIFECGGCAAVACKVRLWYIFSAAMDWPLNLPLDVTIIVRRLCGGGVICAAPVYLCAALDFNCVFLVFHIISHHAISFLSVLDFL